MNRNKRNKNVKVNEAINNMASVNSFDILNSDETNIRNAKGRKQIHRNKS